LCAGSANSVLGSFVVSVRVVSSVALLPPMNALRLGGEFCSVIESTNVAAMLPVPGASRRLALLESMTTPLGAVTWWPTIVMSPAGGSVARHSDVAVS